MSAKKFNIRIKDESIFETEQLLEDSFRELIYRSLNDSKISAVVDKCSVYYALHDCHTIIISCVLSTRNTFILILNNTADNLMAIRNLYKTTIDPHDLKIRSIVYSGLECDVLENSYGIHVISGKFDSLWDQALTCAMMNARNYKLILPINKEDIGSNSLIYTFVEEETGNKFGVSLVTSYGIFNYGYYNELGGFYTSKIIKDYGKFFKVFEPCMKDTGFHLLKDTFYVLNSVSVSVRDTRNPNSRYTYLNFRMGKEYQTWFSETFTKGSCSITTYSNVEEEIELSGTSTLRDGNGIETHIEYSNGVELSTIRPISKAVYHLWREYTNMSTQVLYGIVTKDLGVGVAILWLSDSSTVIIKMDYNDMVTTDICSEEEVGKILGKMALRSFNRLNNINSPK